MSRSSTRVGAGRKALWIVGAIVLGLLLGLGSAALAVRGALSGGRSWRGWSGDPNIGSTAADRWTRARVARTGLLALSKAQTIYFTRYVDERGRPLEARCAYLLSGGPLPARWWSVTLYAADNYLPQRVEGAFSVDATRVHRDWRGGWRARVAPNRADAPDWISTRNAGRFSLTLRLYNPAPAAAANFGAIPMPSLKTLSCEGRGA